MKKIILTAISSFITLSVLALDSGRCGENVTWVFDEATETLTISGSGKMHDYSPNDGIEAPWKRYAYSTFSYSIKKIYIKDGVTSIGSYAFTTCKNLISIEIPNSVTSIGEGAFWGCTELTTFVIPNSVTNIGKKAFYGTQWYKNQGLIIYAGKVFYENHSFNQVIELKAGTIGIADGAFSITHQLTSITIPNSVKSIGKRAFEGCSNLTSIVIPKSVTSIGEYAFSGCSSMISIDIPSGVTYIENRTFYKCTGLTSVKISYGTTSIGDGTFSGCTNLSSITIPNSVTSIGEGAFFGTVWDNNQSNGLVYAGKVIYEYKGTMPANANIHLRDGTIGIAGGAFGGRTSLTSIKVPNSVKCIGKRAFSGCTGLSSIESPNSVISIGEYAFEDCSGLNSIEIPNSVISIGEWAFEDCTNLASIKFSNSITDISIGTFHGCTGIKDFYCFSIECPSTEKNALYGVFSNSSINIATLHVPELAIETYGSTEPWSNFGTIVALPKFRLEYYVDGLLYKSYEIEEGVNIKDYEKKPDKEGYSFSGWMGLPETMPAHDVTVTGTFSINKYKLIYQVDGTDYKTYEVEYGASITTEPAPTKEGYTFSGWSEIPETMPAHDLTIYGTFTINTYKLTYMIDDAVYKVVDYKYGENITPEPQPEGDYASFEWIGVPETMPAHDVTVHASYVTGITNILLTEDIVRIYSPNGKVLNKPQKGLNLVLMRDGTIRKIVIK